MGKYEVLLFDVDGTLLDFEKAEENALEISFRNHQIELNDKIKSRYDDINKGLWKRFEKGEITREEVIYSRFVMLFKEFNIKHDGVKFEDYYQARLGEGAFPIKGAYELCSDLKKRYDMYIITNGVTKTQYDRLAKSGFDKLFKDIFVSEESGSQKPQKEYFDFCFDRMKRKDVENMLVIGDSLSSDIRGANIMNIDSCWYNPNGEENSGGIYPTYEIQNFDQVYDVLGERK